MSIYDNTFQGSVGPTTFVRVSIAILLNEVGLGTVEQYNLG